MTGLRPRNRVAIVFAGLVPLVFTSACSGVAGGSSGSAESSGGQPLSLLLVDQPSTKELQSTLIPQFEKDSGIKVNVEVVPESGLEAKLATATSGSDAQYDVLMTGAKNWGTLVGSQAIRPLNEFLTSGSTPADYVSGFPQTLLENIKVNGQNYAMPYQVGADILYYNKDLYTKAGLDPNSPPKTLAQVVANAEKIKSTTGTAGFVGRGSREGNENSFTWLMMWFLNGGRWPKGDAVNDPAAYSMLTQEPALTATKQYFHLLGDLGPAGASGYTFSDAQKAMQDARAGQWLDAAQLGPALEDPKASKTAGKIGYSALTGTGGQDYNVGAVWGFSIAAKSTNGDNAWKLVQFLTNKQTGVSQVLSGTNGSTGRSDVLADPEVAKKLNPGYVAALKEAVAHTNPAYTPGGAHGPQIRGALALQLSQDLSGDRDANSTMSQTLARIGDILK